VCVRVVEVFFVELTKKIDLMRNENSKEDLIGHEG
jgi:hypothetical protein